MPHTKLPHHKEGAPEIQKGTVLLVDDDELVRKALQRTIRGISRTDKVELLVESVGSAQEGMLMIQSGFIPDVIFSDMMMPDVTGKDFLEWLEKNHPELVSRFCFVSGGAKGGDLEELLRYMKAIGRMVDKPFEIDQIRDVIRSILNVK